MSANPFLPLMREVGVPDAYSASVSQRMLVAKWIPGRSGPSSRDGSET